MKKIFVYKIAFAVAAICLIISLFKSCGNRQDISGTVIAKSGDIKSRYKSTRIYTEYIFAIHPDDSRFSDFDIEVPLHRYIKYDVGDKVVFYDVNINKYLKDPKWYEKNNVWDIICMVLWCFSICFLILIMIEYYRLQEDDYE